VYAGGVSPTVHTGVYRVDDRLRRGGADLAGLRVALRLQPSAAMRSTLLSLLVAAAAAWAIILHLPEEEAQAQPVIGNAAQPGSWELRGVSIDGHELPLAQLRALLGTRAGNRLDPEQLEIDRDALVGALVARGYLAAKVAPASVTYDDGVYVVFDVEKGPLYRVRSVTVTGPGANELVTVVAGDEAIADRIARARQLLADTLERRTRGKVAVDLAVRPDAASATVDVELATRVTMITKSSIVLIR